MAQRVKKLPAMQEMWVQPLGQEYSLEKEMETHSSILGEFHGQRSLAGYWAWSHKELDATERLTLLLSFLSLTDLSSDLGFISVVTDLISSCI